MQIAARPCATCNTTIRRESEGRACVACETVRHRTCAPGRTCPECGARLRRGRDLQSRDAAGDALHLARGRRVLRACATSYALLSLTMSIQLLAVSGDVSRFTTGLVRLAIGLAIFGAISRGSVAAAWLMIALASIAAVGSATTAFGLAGSADSPWPAIEMAVLAIVLGAIAGRMATSRPFWDYVRARRHERASNV